MKTPSKICFKISFATFKETNMSKGEHSKPVKRRKFGLVHFFNFLIFEVFKFLTLVERILSQKQVFFLKSK
jgi:hypothetical protein